ncbi:TetR family transcriptional regulator [Anoxybacillus gonensis]|uniref:TetR/AcrR family transcriptional regulator n=1 Tax=Anoxybacillus gonensis TaxID=198467 RepID=A0AAW7TJ78_9BACL|nr:MULTISPECIES: TetR/AcrR family transcriptional regulator [Anoxybacillus]AKS39037.1 TetR family transcriptional regulator [Anoxybacillus gonensis]KGP59861.1 TetR family transcriptional regulator [Anoxybacillus gonensis]MCX8045645.1 TetR/AcrR family transcriptional regulator [Anoxybacillus gonensis]MDO0878460.1 TetR/AcrR family transcriptional regulator [Anoxybacillus gonensis]
MSRKEQIIEVAMKLFAEKGYHATSMQEIAEHSHLAKGSLYNYFKSKEEIVLSIFQYHYDQLFQQFARIASDRSLTAREKFLKQLSLQIEAFEQHKEIVQMHMGDHAQKVSEDVHALVLRIRSHLFDWYIQSFIDMYGERIRPFVLDCAIMLNGMLKEYLFFALFEKQPFSFQRLAPFLMERLDALVDSLQHDIPLIRHDAQAEKARALLLIDEMVEEARDHHTMELLKQLKEEMEREEPRKAIVEAFLLYLQQSDMRQFVPALRAALVL